MNFLERTFNKLHSPRSSRQQARKLDPHVRQSLCDVVSEETAAGADALREVQAELLLANEKLTIIQEREQFLGIRTRQYRKALDDQMEHLEEEEKRLTAARKKQEKGTVEEEEKLPETLDDVDPEEQKTAQSRVLNKEELEQAETALHRRMGKWQADEEALSSIVETHKVILASCETMRRSILVLQEKEKRILKLTGNCEEFLETAAALGQEEQDGSERIMEQRVNQHDTLDAEDDENERNGSEHKAGTLDAGEVNSGSEDGHLEDVAV